MYDENIVMARRVADAVAREGGRTYYVGGCVRCTASPSRRWKVFSTVWASG